MEHDTQDPPQARKTSRIRPLNVGIWLSLAFVGAVATFLLFAYSYTFRGVDVGDEARAAWGQLGDFIGGILNPIVAGAALFWLTQSVRLQKEELAETRAELARSTEAQLDAALLTALSSLLAMKTTDCATALAELRRVEAGIDDRVRDFNRDRQGFMQAPRIKQDDELWPHREMLAAQFQADALARAALRDEIELVRARLRRGPNRDQANGGPAEPERSLSEGA